jgi:hypothetical protein
MADIFYRRRLSIVLLRKWQQHLESVVANYGIKELEKNKDTISGYNSNCFKKHN